MEVASGKLTLAGNSESRLEDIRPLVLAGRPGPACAGFLGLVAADTGAEPVEFAKK